MSEILITLLISYYACEVVSEQRMMNTGEIALCSMRYEAVKAEIGSSPETAYGEFRLFETLNSELVARLREIAAGCVTRDAGTRAECAPHVF